MQVAPASPAGNCDKSGTGVILNVNVATELPSVLIFATVSIVMIDATVTSESFEITTSMTSLATYFLDAVRLLSAPNVEVV